MLSDLQMFWRFSTGLRRFLTNPLSPEDCRRLLSQSLERRESNFLELLRRAVYGFPKSPWLAILRNAKVDYAGIEHAVRDSGIEAALTSLRDAGVHVSLDEFKGNLPIDRNGLHLPPDDAAFDNPLLMRDFVVMTGGTTGRRRRLAVDLDLLEFEAATQHLFLAAHGLLDRPLALWRPVPPGSSAIKHALRSAKTRRPVAAWFDLSAMGARPPWQSILFLHTAIWQGRRAGNAIPRPLAVPASQPEPVAQWLADRVQAGAPGVLSSPASAAVRVVQFALQQKLNLAGTVFWMGGEPITPAKAAVIEQAGCATVNGWSLSETGPLALGCASREVLDEVHLIHSKVAAIPSTGVTEVDGTTPGAAVPVLLTTLLPLTPKIMLNVEIGDTAYLTHRRCGCPIEAAGLPFHAHTIRADRKLTAGGMQFLFSHLAELTEQSLPAAFGGCAMDYQFVEEEDSGGVTHVYLRVHPRLGSLDERTLLDFVGLHLGGKSRGNAMMVNAWKEGGVLRVRREEPATSVSGKTPALWVRPRL